MHDTIVTAPGSLGDVNPMLSIARTLQSMGRRVLFLAASRYLPLAERAGLATRSLVDEQEFSRLTGDPRLWHPRHGVRMIFQEAVAQFLDEHYDWLEDNCQPGETLLVSHVLDFAGRIYRDRHPTTRFVSVLPAPAMLRSSTAPPRLSGHWWERYYPKSWMPLTYWCADRWLDRVGGGQINKLRQRLGLPAVQRIIHRWWWSPDLVLGMFPSWFNVPAADLPPQMQLTGFPLADSGDVVAESVTQLLAQVLQHFEGQPPIVFAPGTAHHHAGSFLQSACEACRATDRPGVLLSTDSGQLPQNLPPRVLTANYLPFRQLLPQAAGIVHHGGVGTTSQAFAAGTPQIVLPMAFDQFDNAERVEKLQCGSWLPMQKLTTPRLIAHLRQLPDNSGGVSATRARLDAEPPFAVRVQEIFTEFLSRRSQSGVVSS